MFEKLKQIKNLRDQAKKLQDTLADEKVEGSGAWGKIKLTMDGNQQIINVSIEPELLSPDKKTKVEEGIKEAFGDCLKKIQRIMLNKMKDSGISLPELKE